MDRDPRRNRARRSGLSEAERDRIAEALRLAERLGGETVTMPGRRCRRGHCRVCAGQQFHPHRHREVAAPTLVRTGCAARSTHRLIRHAGDISVHVIAEREERDASQAHRPPVRRAAPPIAGVGRERLLAVGRLCRGGARHRPCRAAIPGRRRNIALVFLTAVLASAIALRAVAVAVRLLSSACWRIISSSCRRSTPSRSPIPRTSSLCSSSRSSRWSRAI